MTMCQYDIIIRHFLLTTTAATKLICALASLTEIYIYWPFSIQQYRWWLCKTVHVRLRWYHHLHFSNTICICINTNRHPLRLYYLLLWREYELLYVVRIHEVPQCILVIGQNWKSKSAKIKKQEIFTPGVFVGQVRWWPGIPSRTLQQILT